MSRDYDSPNKRLEQLQRVLILIRLISPLRYGATLRDLHRDMNDTYGKMCERTVRRDLIALEIIGLVDRQADEHGKTKYLWVRHQSTAVFEMTARQWIPNRGVNITGFVIPDRMEIGDSHSFMASLD